MHKQKLCGSFLITGFLLRSVVQLDPQLLVSSMFCSHPSLVSSFPALPSMVGVVPSVGG